MKINLISRFKFLTYCLANKLSFIKLLKILLTLLILSKRQGFPSGYPKVFLLEHSFPRVLTLNLQASSKVELVSPLHIFRLVAFAYPRDSISPNQVNEVLDIILISMSWEIMLNKKICNDKFHLLILNWCLFRLRNMLIIVIVVIIVKIFIKLNQFVINIVIITHL